MIYLEIKENKTILEYVALYTYYLVSLGAVAAASASVFGVAWFFANIQF